MKYTFKTALMLLFLSPIYLSAAEVKPTKSGTFFISGEIKKGDYADLLRMTINNDKIPPLIGISSPGGDVLEAMKIGRFIRKNHITVFSVSPCDSACVLIMFSAVNRMSDNIGGKLGLHRPYYNPEYFSKLSSEQASKKYNELDEKVRRFLKEMNVPTLIVDKMFSIPSSRIEYLNVSAFDNLAGKYPPAYFEWMASRCGVFEKHERQDYKYVSSYFGIKDHPEVKLDPNNSADNTILRFAEKAKDFQPGYRNYLYKKGKKISACEENAIEKEREANFKELNKEWLKVIFE